MTDSMKFGPEWLRNMSSDIGGGGHGGQSSGGMSNMFGQNNNNINSGNNNNSTSNISSISAPRYQLAEYRYGREEMLSLCEKVRLPEILPKYKKLFVEKLNGPLALTPNTDDDAVGYERTLWPVRGVPPTIGISSRGARGGSIDRGRGRGRGSYHSTLGYQRSSSMYDEDARGGGRATWLERNGSDTSEWNGASSTSPRKEYITRNSSMESWRRSRDDDSTSTTSTSTTTIASETWRGIGPGGPTTGYKWARSQSWRDEDPSSSHNNNDSRSFNSSSISDRNSIGVGGKPSMAANVPRKSLHTWNDDENLPEWAMEDPIEGGGSFDSSGAFHGTHEDDDSQAIDCNAKSNRKISTQIDDSNSVKKEPSVESAPASQTLSQKLINQSQPPEKLDNKELVVDDKKIAVTNETDKWRPSQMEQTDSADSQNKKIDGTVEDANKENSSATVNMANDAKKESIVSNTPVTQLMISDCLIGNAISDDNQNQQQSLVQSMLQSQQKQQLHKLSRPPMSETLSVDRMQEVADDMVEKLIMDDEMSSGGRDVSDSINLLRKKSDNMPPHQLHKDSQQYTVQSEQWLYRDPQGKIQGPFTATEMNEWYRLGYFDENLHVRQMFDSHFVALGDLVKQRGHVPFSPPTPSHALKNNLPTPHAPHEIPPSNIPQMKAAATLTPLLPSDSLSLEYQYQYQQAEYLKQKRASIRKLLSATDPWPLLSAEQQTDMINQRMAEFPEYLMLPTSMSAKQSQSHGMPPNLSHKPILKQQQSPAASSQQHMFNNHDFIASNTTSSSDPSSTSAMRSIMQQISLNQLLGPLSIPMQQQQQQQHQPSSQPSSQIRYDPIQSLMMQLAMQNSPSTNPVAIQQTGNQLSLDKGSSNNSGWMGTNIGVSHQSNLNQPSAANVTGSTWPTNRGTWSIPMSAIPVNHKQPTTINQQQQQMKTEKLIRDDVKTDEQQTKDDLINWKIPNLTVQQQFATQQVVQQQQQQQQLLEKQIIEKQRQEKQQKRDADSDKKSLGSLKIDEEKQKQSKRDAAKSDGGAAAVKKDTKVDEKKKETDEKKRQKELKRQQAEDDRRRQQEEEKRRQYIEEKKRLEDIAEQRKAKLMEGQRRSQQNDQSQSQQRQNINPSVAPWSLNPVTQVAKPSLSLAEIQKAERERRAEQSRIEQMIREQQQTQNLIESQQQKESSQKWNLQPHSVKSLAEIQAEESKRQVIADQIALNAIAAANTSTKKRETDQAQQHFASIWNTNTTNAGPMWNSAKMWSNGNSTSSGGFWEEPIKNTVRISNSTNTTVVSSGSSGNMPAAGSKPLVKSQTVSNMQQAAAKSTSKLQSNASKSIAKTNSSGSVSGNVAKTVKSGKKDREASENSNHEFNVWCCKALAAHEKVIDVPTFVTFLRDLESPFEVKDYIRMYLGETKECTEFAKQFLERRSKYKNQQRAANAHIDDMCSPAPAITPSNDFQEVKGKGKKEKKKNKMLKLDSRILGFSVTAAQDRLNVGDRDYSYGEAP